MSDSGDSFTGDARIRTAPAILTKVEETAKEGHMNHTKHRRTQKSRPEILFVRLLELFPGCPPEIASAIIQGTCRDRRGVGWHSSLHPDRQVRGAVCAYIRHKYTPYDALLSQGWDRDAAREVVAAQIDEVFAEWSQPPTSEFERIIARLKAILRRCQHQRESTENLVASE
jgi:hypothetical protein